MSEARLRNLYLPPFKAAIDAGADTVMCSFNAINGVPGCANSHTETDILKKEWGLDGFIESDYTADEELRACPPVNPATGPCGHGIAADGPSAAALSLNAGTDQHMVSTNIRDFGQQLLASGESRWPGSTTRSAGSCGSSSAPACSTTRTSTRPRPGPGPFLTPADRAAARTAAAKSMVLLKNDDACCRSSPSQEDRGHRPARRRPARHARPVVGHGPGRGRREPVRPGSRRRTRTRRSPRAAPASNVDPPDARDDDACSDLDVVRRCRPRPGRPTRSCSPSARPGR